MTRDEAREFAKVVQAYADGKAIQSLWSGGGGWADVNPNVNPTFNCATYSYRIKPEPREWWVVPNAAHAAASKDEAEDLAESMEWPTSSIVHVREVTP